MTTTPEEYLRDGPWSPWHVPDLVPANPSQIRLLLVLESPHRDELAASRPVVGEAGHSALRFLQGPSWAGESLGNFVGSLHLAGNERIAVMNVATVPLQERAFEGRSDKPDLEKLDWLWLSETFRKSRATTVNQTPSQSANATGQLLLDGLQDRIDSHRLSSDCTVVACGIFAKRYVRQLYGLPGVVLTVNHPSNNLWHRNPTPKTLKRVRKLFRKLTK